MRLVDLPDPPLRLIVGGRSFDLVNQMNQARAEEYRAWEHRSRLAPG
ncbi:hypothetical protein [Streptosporangium sp. NPDC020145]|uniref:Uncharacterized protein n=1 Tax=Streptosporangium jomthongense TaxID=1193683 RepID=A0ABV8FDA7_9ACTN